VLSRHELGVAAADYPAAADWYTRAANAGHAAWAVDLCTMYTAGPAR
jgi:TPR repeat protein